MARTGYTTVALPDSLMAEIDQMVSKKGYTSRAELLKEAVRKYLREIK